MWRAFITAIGVSMCIVGAECMVIDRVVVADSVTKSDSTLMVQDYSSWNNSFAPQSSRRVFVPPEWAPWGLLSGGVVTVLYAQALGGSGE